MNKKNKKIELKKKNVFRIFFNWITNAGVTYYRMISPGKYMRRMKNVEVAYSNFRPDAHNPPQWEQDIVINRKTMDNSFY